MIIVHDSVNAASITWIIGKQVMLASDSDPLVQYRMDVDSHHIVLPMLPVAPLTISRVAPVP